MVIKSQARVAELADALASGASVRKNVGVQVPPRAQTDTPCEKSRGVFSFAPSLTRLERVCSYLHSATFAKNVW